MPGVMTLSDVPEEKQERIAEVTSLISGIKGIAAVALGGSYAAGRWSATSDLDFGLYYRESSPFAIEEIEDTANKLSGDSSPIVTDFYRWGPWVNGGAWIQTRSGKVDFLYRNLDQIERTIDDAKKGVVEHHYGQQPPYGFYSVIYLAETKIAIPLFDPAGTIEDLKRRIEPYPEKLRDRILDQSLWSAEFTFQAAYAAAANADVYTTVGCIGRIAASLTQALFAVNREYFLTDKRIGTVLKNLEQIPASYVEKLEQVLGRPGSDAEQLTASVNLLNSLWQEIVYLTNGIYRPHYVL